MNKFEKSSDVYDAGFALPSYSVERNSRTWRYRDKFFTTPVSEPVEKIIFAGDVLDALPITKNES